MREKGCVNSSREIMDETNIWRCLCHSFKAKAYHRSEMTSELYKRDVPSLKIVGVKRAFVTASSDIYDAAK